MICPKCSDVMRTVDRQGIHIEQCANCSLRTALLRRSAVYEPPSGYPRQQPRYEDRGDYRHYDPKYHKRKKRKDFLEGLFDF